MLIVKTSWISISPHYTILTTLCHMPTRFYKPILCDHPYVHFTYIIIPYPYHIWVGSARYIVYIANTNYYISGIIIRLFSCVDAWYNNNISDGYWLTSYSPSSRQYTLVLLRKTKTINRVKNIFIIVKKINLLSSRVIYSFVYNPFVSYTRIILNTIMFHNRLNWRRDYRLVHGDNW